jgi:molecular chaperone DnaJ
LSRDEKKAMEQMQDSDNFRPSGSVKERIFKKFKSMFD